ncbi:YlqD family protein [Niallia sp. FSL W8-0635]|uniref:YlqD family protein n=1 Tax=Niallia sp. FSL W8-0635 TaxID=2975337 RepID=UPI0009C98FCA|nr:Protein of uncharacterised function (DUF2869) [Mycobacteroides abscessus subsp. abscessus]HEO8419038.1 YlqD family protein [Yersinia enterocolitica]
MKILQSVTVKQVLTEATRKSISNRYMEEIQQLEKEVQQLHFEEKKQLKNHPSGTEIKKFFRKEVTNKLEKQKTIEFQLNQLHILPLGTEIKEQEVMAVVDVQVGQAWESTNKTIIVKDGIVVDIR